MLPFMHPKRLVGTIMSNRGADGTEKSRHPEGTPAPELLAAAKKLQEGHQLSDVNKIAEALSDAHQHLNKKLHPNSED